jgi:hypothetical protein
MTNSHLVVQQETHAMADVGMDQFVASDAWRHPGRLDRFEVPALGFKTKPFLQWIVHKISEFCFCFFATVRPGSVSG